MTAERERAKEPEDLARLWVERANEADAEGMAALYEPDAIMAFPIGREHVGRDAIQKAFEGMLANFSYFPMEESLPTLRLGDLALTSSVPQDNSRGRYQVARRQPDGTWLRVLHSSGYFGEPT
ncbi:MULTISPECIES: YybH family protein [Streptomyces]|uniref:SnoaL-like domain-containing protein n=1 Tax=Streptomyces olivaceiscleroticus TaxID=68245 RepID=A0ABN1ABV4_9ACTN|nr:nuclear transport factor 2 family protein [Streptomyces niger]